MTAALEGGEGSASRPGRSLPPGKTRYPLHRRLGGPQGRSGQVRKISPPTGIRSPEPSARSQSLYLLRYPPHRIRCTLYKIMCPTKSMEPHDYRKCSNKTPLFYLRIVGFTLRPFYSLQNGRFCGFGKRSMSHSTLLIF